MNSIKEEILEILYEDALTPTDKIALMLGIEEKKVEKYIAELKSDNIIVKYHAMINWDKTDSHSVEAIIEVKVTPQRDRGFESIAKRIYKFDEVKSVYLMSGTYDLMVLISGDNLRQVASFVSEKLSTIDGVLSTATHFVLKRYKEDGVVLDDNTDERLVVSP
ncbi:MAG: Lrp/AsnC family transcriptional regulator [Clostridia bacterium]|nr:Lrp/AsnC family transcriptional regulator [Clostridia bacterium]